MPSAPHQITHLLHWLQEQGARFDKVAIQEYSEEYRGVHASTDVSSDEMVVLIPRAAIMTTEHAQRSPSGSKLVQSNIALRSRHTFLALYLLDEKAKGTESYWSPYLDLLPQSYSTMPLNFPPSLLNELKGSFTLEKIDARISSLQEEYNDIHPLLPHYSFDEFVWARNVVITRVFGLVIDGVKTEGLVPLADMLNHKRPRDTKWTFDNRLQSFTITTLNPIAQGHVISDSYGRKCNSRFFVNYGFALEENADNECVLIACHSMVSSGEIPPKDCFSNEFLQLLRCMPLGNLPFENATSELIQSIESKQDLPAYKELCYELGIEPSLLRRSFQLCANPREKKCIEFFSYLRLLNCTKNEIETLYRRRRQQHVHLGTPPPLTYVPPVSVENEIKVLRELERSARTTLEGFSTTLKQDEHLLSTQELEGNRRNCIVMRHGEKQVALYYLRMAIRCRGMLVRFQSVQEFDALYEYVVHETSQEVKGVENLAKFVAQLDDFIEEEEEEQVVMRIGEMEQKDYKVWCGFLGYLEDVVRPLLVKQEMEQAQISTPV